LPDQAKKAKKPKHSDGRQQLVDSRNFFTGSIFKRGGNEEAVENSTVTLHRNAFGMSPRQLHDTYNTGGDRGQLPEVAQRWLGIQETACGYAVQDHEFPDGSAGNQGLINKKIDAVVHRQSREVNGALGGLFRRRLKQTPPPLSE